METGTWNGTNAARMIVEAQKHNQDICYTGFDLFEDATEQTDKEEFNVKPHHRMADVERYLSQSGAQITLIKGNTRDALKQYTADFAFIDGGHSLETIEHDYQALKHSRVILFDDYYSPDQKGHMPDIRQVGCNLLVQRLPHAVISSPDPVEGGGFVNLAIVFGVP